ncbi:CgeB family protein [Oceanirhabdus seepicola]|uniref:Glycosyltransferase n=1 Tax=Oceanirhabdus seepicola TaxID=2828781 RepID=A0A9J6P1G3_9CLOT|nr:glycosyltransferase [Oceanirhabdus seepicola]MCM1989296.1 glycosyltransferase [Oceanirhabdus seepicola]
MIKKLFVVNGKKLLKKSVRTLENRYRKAVNRILINRGNFFVEKNSDLILGDNNRFLEVQSFLENSQQRYLSYLEANTNFNKLPSKKKLKVDTNCKYKIQFVGEKFKNINVSLAVIFYSENKKISIEFININKEKIIIPNKKSKYIRFGIRIKGSGKCFLKEIRIFKISNCIINKSKSPKKIINDKPKSIKELKIAGIFDDFTMRCFQGMCKVISFNPDNWNKILNKDKPHILIVESAWKGNGGSWKWKVGAYNKNYIKGLKELIKLIKWCKQNSIPTVFWNKEDPVHFKRFIKTAQFFDYVFTTDVNCLKDYKKFLNHNRVYCLPFAAQPKVHNPIKLYENRENKICFAGAYYAAKYKDRQVDMQRIFNAAVEYGLDIYDRHFEDNNPNYLFPSKYKTYIKGKLVGDEINKAYKGYKVMINVSSVKNSDTMFARRVFEGVASYTPIVSSYSKGIKKIFGDIITSSDDINELKEAFKLLMNDEEYYNQKALTGLRLVLSKHTYEERLHYILSKVGMGISKKSPKISVFSIIRSLKEFKMILKKFKSQSYDNKELVLILKEFEGNKNIVENYNNKNIRSFLLSSVNNDSKIMDIFKGDFISCFSNNNFYGKHYLEDLALATKYTEANIIGKKAIYSFDKKSIKNSLEIKNNGCEFEYTDDLLSSVCIIHKNLLKSKKTREIIFEFSNDSSMKNYSKLGYSMFSIDKYNFIQNCNYNLKDYEIISKVEI